MVEIKLTTELTRGCYPVSFYCPNCGSDMLLGDVVEGTVKACCKSCELEVVVTVEEK